MPYQARVTREGKFYVIVVEGIGATQTTVRAEVVWTTHDMLRAVLGDDAPFEVHWNWEEEA